MYTYKGNNYKFIEEGLAKDRKTGEWYDVVYYRNEEGKLFCRERIEFYKRFKWEQPPIPYHISVMGKFFGKIKDDQNVATGEIRKFIVPPKSMKKGQRISSTENIGDEEYCALWVYISQGYFKQIGLWKIESELIPAI